MSTVDRQGGADLPGQWDIDPEGLIETATLRFPPGPAVTRPHHKGRTHDCKRLRASHQFLLASRGPSTHVPWGCSSCSSAASSGSSFVTGCRAMPGTPGRASAGNLPRPVFRPLVQRRNWSAPGPLHAQRSRTCAGKCILLVAYSMDATEPQVQGE